MIGQLAVKLAQRHRLLALDLISSSPNTVVVVVPGVKTTKIGATMFADLDSTPATPVTKGPFRCLWYDSISNVEGNTADLVIVGRYPTATTYLKVALEDALTDPLDPYSETWFDLATEVVYRGQKYAVEGVHRHGMSVLPPYVLLVVLKGEVRRRV